MSVQADPGRSRRPVGPDYGIEVRQGQRVRVYARRLRDGWVELSIFPEGGGLRIAGAVAATEALARAAAGLERHGVAA